MSENMQILEAIWARDNLAAENHGLRAEIVALREENEKQATKIESLKRQNARTQRRLAYLRGCCEWGG